MAYGKKDIYGGASDMRPDFRPGRSFEEVLIENDQYEMGYVKRIRVLFQRGDMAALGQYLEQLKAEGWSVERIDSLVKRAMYGIKM